MTEELWKKIVDPSSKNTMLPHQKFSFLFNGGML
jgi:hypothetical protein